MEFSYLGGRSVSTERPFFHGLVMGYREGGEKGEPRRSAAQVTMTECQDFVLNKRRYWRPFHLFSQVTQRSLRGPSMAQDRQSGSERLTRRKIPQQSTNGKLSPVPAWMASIVFHLIMFTTLAAFWRTRSAGNGQETGGPMGIAVVYESVDGQDYYLFDNSDSASAGGGIAAALQSLPGEAKSGSTQSGGALADLLPAGDAAVSELLQGAGTLGLGDGQGELGGERGIPKVKTSVFGIEGEGTRFLYVFDRSDSMNGFQGKPLSMAKSELMGSLESLGRLHEFQIIFYNDSPLPFGGFGGVAPGLLRADDQSKQNAQRFVRDIAAIGGTRHIDALRMAVGMNPDVVFFLTDADFPAPAAADIENIHARAARAGATIHSIQFGSGPNQASGGWIRELAEGTLGKYRYVDVSQF